MTAARDCGELAACRTRPGARPSRSRRGTAIPRPTTPLSRPVNRHASSLLGQLHRSLSRDLPNSCLTRAPAPPHSPSPERPSLRARAPPGRTRTEEACIYILHQPQRNNLRQRHPHFTTPEDRPEPVPCGLIVHRSLDKLGRTRRKGAADQRMVNLSPRPPSRSCLDARPCLVPAMHRDRTIVRPRSRDG